MKKPTKPAVAAAERPIKIICENRKARHNFFIEDQFEAGIVLTGTEVKSCRQGKAHLNDAYGLEHHGEFFLQHAHISSYNHSGEHDNHEPLRLRKLLMHKQEIKKLYGRVREKGYTLVPLKMYFKGPYVKIQLGLGRGKKQHDKRATLKEKEHKREIDRAFKDKQRK